MTDRQIGVLIDYENVGLGSMQSLFDQLSEVGRIIIKRAYGDLSRTSVKAEQALELGIEFKHYFRAPGSEKNASDILLAIDAIELLHSSPLDTFVIVSSDTDFVPLVSKLRAEGKMVFGAGRRATVSPALVHSCDRYVYLDDREATAQAQPALKAHADALLERAMNSALDDEGQVVAAKLHNTMLRMDPSFDYRALGHRNLSQFLEASAVVTVRRSRGQGDHTVELAPRQPGSRGQSSEPEGAESWEEEIDIAWARIPGEAIAGSKAAGEAAKALGITRLSASRYKNLDGLFGASPLLSSKWHREGNTVRSNEH